MAEKDNLQSEKTNEDLLNYQSSNMPPDWQLSGNTLSNSSMGLISSSNLEQHSCSNAKMMDSFSATMWDQPSNSHNLGFSDSNVQHNTNISNALGGRVGGLGPLRAGLDSIVGLGTGWTPPNATLKGGIFPLGAPGFLPQSLAHFPADSSFIERAARYSCFSGGNFSEIMNSFNLPESVNSYSRCLAPMLGSQEALMGNGLKPVSETQPQKNEMNLAESSKHVSLPAECKASEKNLLNIEKKSESLMRSHDDAKGGVGASGNDSDEAEFSGRGGQEELEGADGESTPKGVGSKKRKRCGQVGLKLLPFGNQ